MALKKILCYGDSNTYGLDPRQNHGERLKLEERFTGRLISKGWDVVEQGMNGRQIPILSAEFEELSALLSQVQPLDCLLIMLGSNDAIFMSSPSAAAIAKRMDTMLSFLEHESSMQGSSILLVAPPVASIPGIEWRCSIIRALSSEYKQLAERHNTAFLAAGTSPIPLAYDGIHLSPDGHLILAEKIDFVLRTLFGNP